MTTTTTETGDQASTGSRTQRAAGIEIELDDMQQALKQAHPALDMVDDVLYVTVWTPIKGKGMTQVVLSSEGDVFTLEEWQAESIRRGLILMTSNVLAPQAKCSPSVVAELQAGELQTPTMSDVYDRIYAALAERLEVRDERYLVVMALFTMMTYFHPLFDTLPILHLRGPAASGKSRAGRCIAAMAFNGEMKGNPTPATLFRTADRSRHTVIVAEGDNLAVLDSGERSRSNSSPRRPRRRPMWMSRREIASSSRVPTIPSAPRSSSRPSRSSHNHYAPAGG